MCNEGSIMKMEGRDNHTLGHVKTRLEPECSECTRLLAVNPVIYPLLFLLPISIPTLVLDVCMYMMKCFIDILRALYINLYKTDDVPYKEIFKYLPMTDIRC